MYKSSIAGAVVACLLAAAPASAQNGKGKEPDKGGKAELVVHAKASGKLSPRLNAIKMSGGQLVGTAPNNGVVVSVADAGRVEKKLRDAGAKVSKERPDKVQQNQRLMLTFKKGDKINEATVKKAGL